MKKIRLLLVGIAVLAMWSLSACGGYESDNGGSTGEKIDGVVNLKTIAIQDEWVYHFKEERSFSKHDGLYKTKLDNSESKLISEDFGTAMILDGDWIYYSSFTSDDKGAIYKIKTDGSEKIKLCDDSVRGSMIGAGMIFELDEGWLYYSSMSESGALFRVKTDGSAREKLAQDGSSEFYIEGDYIYCNGGLGIYNMKKDGTEKSEVFEGEDVMIMGVTDKYIYFMDMTDRRLTKGDTRILKRSNLDESDIIDMENIYDICKFEFEGDWIYYIRTPNIKDPSSPEEKGIYRANIDGSNIEKITEDDSLFMSIEGDWIYYISTERTNPMMPRSYKLNRMKLDGSDKKTFETEGIFVFNQDF